jgi:EAL domain-containing protein (putative c-di-GMP-specific phosphodiesterase class I)
LSLQVVAEGTETNAQRQALLTKGCDGGQGFLYGRPVPFGVLVSGGRRDALSHRSSVLARRGYALWRKSA